MCKNNDWSIIIAAALAALKERQNGYSYWQIVDVLRLPADPFPPVPMIILLANSRCPMPPPCHSTPSPLSFYPVPLVIQEVAILTQPIVPLSFYPVSLKRKCAKFQVMHKLLWIYRDYSPYYLKFRAYST